MTAESDLVILYEIGLIIVCATIASKICTKIRLPGLIGALFVGLFLGGPGGIGLFHESDELQLFGTFGAILLLFMSGLQFDAEMFFAVGKKVFLLTSVGVALAILSGYGLGILLGWTPTAALLLGVMISFSGTSVISAILLQKQLINTEEGTAIMTAAITDDVIGIIVFSITLSTLGGNAIAVSDVILNIITAILFVVLSIFLGHKALTKTISKLVRFLKEDDLFLIFIGFGLIIAYLAAQYFGLSALTGAFIVGAIIPRNEIAKEFGTKFNLMKDVFVALFFTGIGVIINPFQFGSVFPIAMIVLGVALISRFSGTIIGGYITKNNPKTILGAAIGLGIRGELSLIIAQEGIAQNLVNNDFLIIAFLVLIGSIILSIPVFNYWMKKVEVLQS